MTTVDLDQLRAQYSGSRYAQLVERHLYRQTPAQRMAGVAGTVRLLPAPIQPLVEGFIDRWNERAYDAAFWSRDTAAVFDEIIADGRRLLASASVDQDDETLFNLFNIITLSFAYSAHDQPKMRKFMGLKTAGFPIASAVALVVPIAALLRIRSTPANTSLVIGYVISQLAYVLLVAGFFGSFRILGLQNRKQVWGTAAVAFVIGLVLSNLRG